MNITQTGLDRLLDDKNLQDLIKGNIGYLCHGASIHSTTLESGISGLKRIFGERLQKLFTPQHGMFGDVQANMIETQSGQHPFFDLPVYSLYSETRIPTDAMLAGINSMIIDLQDVGTRVYTYIHTMTHVMEACGNKDINIIILDRPNPIDGVTIEGNILEPEYASFVGRFPIPMRHSLTMGEMAQLACSAFGIECQLTVIPMLNWERQMTFQQTGLPWVLPSPNIPTPETCIPYVGGVLLEGCTISEGRGTTRVFELFGHPDIEPYSWLNNFSKCLAEFELTGFTLRPTYFMPTFDKFKGQTITASTCC